MWHLEERKPAEGSASARLPGGPAGIHDTTLDHGGKCGDLKDKDLWTLILVPLVVVSLRLHSSKQKPETAAFLQVELAGNPTRSVNKPDRLLIGS